MSYRLASRPLRQAAGFILAAVHGKAITPDNRHFPGGIVSISALERLWTAGGNHPETFTRAAQALLDNGQIRVLNASRNLIVAEDWQDPDMSGGRREDEIVPYASADHDYDFQKEAVLPVGLGGSSRYDWDVFDSYYVENGQIMSHLGRLIEGCS